LGCERGEEAPGPIATMHLELTVNGTERGVGAAPSESLLDVLRRSGYTGAKRGCDTGDCGFCTVVVDGEPIKSCVQPAAQVDGAAVETIEGLGAQDDLHPIQAAFVDNAAVQCGFCIPGTIMRTKALLEETPEPDEAEIREALSGNLCRCTGYERILDAVADAADRMAEAPNRPREVDPGQRAGGPRDGPAGVRRHPDGEHRADGDDG